MTFSFTRLKNAFEYFLAPSASDQPRGQSCGKRDRLSPTASLSASPLHSAVVAPQKSRGKPEEHLWASVFTETGAASHPPTTSKRSAPHDPGRPSVTKKIGGKTNPTSSQMTNRLHHILVQPEEAETPKNFGLQMENLGTLNQNCQVPRMWIQGLHWRSSDEDSMLPMQGAKFQSLVREGVPTGCNQES